MNTKKEIYFEDVKKGDNLYLLYIDKDLMYHIKKVEVEYVKNNSEYHNGFKNITLTDGSNFNAWKNHRITTIETKSIQTKLNTPEEHIMAATSIDLAIDRIFMDKQRAFLEYKNKIEHMMKQIMSLMSPNYKID